MRLLQEIRLEQRLSPQIIQSLKLLQLPTLELERFLKQELEENPLLEEIQTAEVSPEVAVREATKDTAEQFDEQQWREVLTDSRDVGGRGFRPDVSREFAELPQPAEVGLQEYLLSQLHLSGLMENQIPVGEEIIGNINEDGYLEATLEDIAQGSHSTVEDVEEVLTVIQTFDPAGVGARDLGECLAIQLKEMDLENTIYMAIVEEHLEDLQHHRYPAIAKALDIYESDVQEAVEELSRLNPKPAAGEFGTTAKTIIPDLIVEKVDGNYLVLFNDSSLPRLRISNLYKEILAKDTKANEETRQYVLDKLNGARWLMRSIQQRRSTMLKVMEYIVKAQHEFLEHGLLHLKSMTLQEVADAIGMHISTVSRVTNGKYVQTPQGIFELKFFFSGRIENRDGGDVSTRAIKERIERLVREENGHKPLSDQKIAEALQEEGFTIARRTVAKYRDKMGILPARYRRQY
jgi:RNA polymerase sigma-54 factor